MLKVDNAVKVREFLDTVLYCEQRVICIEIDGQSVHLLGVHKKKTSFYIWKKESILMDSSDESDFNYLQQCLTKICEKFIWIKRYRVLYIYPELKTIYRKCMGIHSNHNDNKAMNLLNITDEFRVVTDNGLTGKYHYQVNAFAKSDELLKIENIFSDFGMWLAGIYKGNPEWIYVYLLQNPQSFSGANRFVYFDTKQMLDVQIDEGKCISIQSKPATSINENSLKQNGYLSIYNRTGNLVVKASTDSYIHTESESAVQYS